MPGRAFLGIPRELVPWAPRVDPDACVGCGECVTGCPNGVFVMDDVEGKVRVVEPENCVVLCDKCAGFCATDAITFPDKQEIKKLLQQLLQERRGKETSHVHTP